MVVDIETMPIAAVVELVNGWASAARREDGRDAGPYPPVSEIAGRLGIPAQVSTTLTEQELSAAADRLHLVFAAPDAASRAQRVNDYLHTTGVRPTLRAAGTELHRAWSLPDADVAVLGAAVIALREFLAEHDPDRLGLCTARRCADVYVDASPAGRRRFCSVNCQNRTRLAAFRSRHGRSGE
jgi:predicted RNA-binding Zn ribbon-like protein